MGMKLTSAADYAVRAMIHLACLPESDFVLRTDIAEAQRIPTSFMAKILRNLVRAGLLRSSRGVNGGFALSRPPAEIHMLDIVEAIEGPLALTDCTPNGKGCSWHDDCPAAVVWCQLQESMREGLRAVSLEDLVSMPRRNGRVARVSDAYVAQAASGASSLRT
jgi:Rrf2 family transcriptional regulator, iron-sulfur cluster assembly transcription factor